ncbi:unnamed protein product [Pelagomonas calceolata]|uniref:Uncharacterized protein n=1 Tax=Pelagomonas calceolata TaxID=35677 RepID=A0A8J2WVK4_9STRA|nr:unnamed protein product [Pelagomonas calceolata]
MGDGKKKERTKYSLHRNIPVEIPAGFDQLCDPEGARIINAAGEPTVDGVVGPSPSTLFSAVGSLFVWVIFVVLAHMIFTAYQTDPPQINELTLDTPKGFEAPFPDFAVTLSLTGWDIYIATQIRQIKAAHGSSMTWKEAEKEAGNQWNLLSEDERNLLTCEKGKCDNRTLEYLWPVFRWESTSGGFVKKTDVHTLLGPEDGVHFGDKCGLSVSTNLKYGRWPVFCFLNRELPPERQRMLRGRDFGDPLWSYLDVRIVRCTNMSAAAVEYEKGYTNTSVPFPAAWSGTCAPHDDIDALVDAGQGLGVNLFFKSPQEPDWTESSWNQHAGDPADNSMENGWTMHEYQKLSSTSHVECDLYLKHTSAYVNRPQSSGFEEEDFFKIYKWWFDFDRSQCSRSYADDSRFEEYSTSYRYDWSDHAMGETQGENRTRFFDISVRMNHKRRKIEVRRQNILEMLSDIGGSWEPSFFLGWLVVVVINRALMAASACPRSRKEAKDVWAGLCGRGAPGAAPKVAPAKAPAPAPAADAAPAPAPAAEAPLSPAAKRWKSLAMNWKRLKRQMQSANYFQLLNSGPPEAPAPPPLDPRKFAELLERVEQLEKRLEEQPRRS